MTSGLGNVQLRYVDSLQEAFNFKEWLGQRRPLGAVALDLETGEYPGKDKKDALSPWHGKIRLLQIGDSQTGWAIPWEEWAGLFYETFTNFNGPIICHNIAFEAKWMMTQSKWKFPWHLAHDTMLMSQIIDPAAKTHALKPLTARLVDPMAAYAQQKLDDAFTQNGWTWGTIPTNFDLYWQYGALDTVITSRIFHDHFYPKVQPGAALSIPYELEMATRRIATTMEVNGARIDLPYSERKHKELMEYVDSIKSWAYDHYGASITSPVQMAKLFESMGAQITKRTPTGNPSVDKEQLDLFTRDDQPEVRKLAETIINQRKADKLASSYFENFINRHVDGLLHPEIRIMAARTGRMSITEPALQTLPSNDPLVRNAFLPRNEDEVIISSDLDQVEFRLTANFSEDPALIELFLEADRVGGDVFTSIMQQVYQDNTLQKSDPRRKLIKGCVPLTSEIFTRRGWLSYDQVVAGDETLGYNLETGKSEWTTIEGVHVFDDADIFKLSNGHKTFYCTDDHRWVADNGRSGARGSKPQIIYANEFLDGDKRLILAADAEDGPLDVSDDEAYLLGWILGDGSIKRSEFVDSPSQASGSRVRCEVRIYQTKPSGIALVESAVAQVPHKKFSVRASGQNVWAIDSEYSRELLSRAGIYDKNTFNPWELASGLSLSARRAMIRGLDGADGKNKKSYRKNGKIDVAIVQSAASPVAELIVALGYLTGSYSRTTVLTSDIANPNRWQKNPVKVVWHQPGRMTNHRASLVYESTGQVWCVTTGLGTWTMRQEHDSVPVLTGNTVYGKLYGAGVDKMAATAGVQTHIMREVVDSFDRTYPGVKLFQKRTEREGLDRLNSEGVGYVTTRTGRNLPCDEDRVYSLTNYLIQGSAAEIFKQNLIKLDQAELTEYLVVPVHDEIVMSVPKDLAEEIKPIVQECMTTREGWAVPLTSGVGGPYTRWGDAYS